MQTILPAVGAKVLFNYNGSQEIPSKQQEGVVIGYAPIIQWQSPDGNTGGTVIDDSCLTGQNGIVGNVALKGEN